MQYGQVTRQPVPVPEPLTEGFNRLRAMIPEQGKAPLFPTAFDSDRYPQPAMQTRSGMRLPATPATPGQPRQVAISPLDFPLG